MSLQLSRREQALLGVLAAAVLGYLFITFVHQPITTARAEAREQRDAAAASLRQHQAQLRQEGDLDAREARVIALEQELRALVPGKHSAGLFVDYLARIEEETGVHMVGLQAGEAEMKEEMLELSLDLKATGTFTHHILLQQELDSVPLFFRLHGWELTRNAEEVFAQAREKVNQGEPWAAEALLREPPKLEGQYRLVVYFRPQQMGPNPEGTGAAGDRLDPFASDLVSQFAEELEKAYGEAGVPGFAPTPPAEEDPAQLG